MHTKYTHNKLTWIDLENPKRKEVLELMETHDLHPLVAEELIKPSIRPRVELHDNCIYLILHFPRVHEHKNGETQQEIDFIIGKDFLITAHYDTVDPLHTFSKMFEVNSILDKSNIGNHAGFLFYYMIRDLYKNLAFEMDEIAEDLKDIEAKIFSGEETAMVQAISDTNRKLLHFRKAIRFHKKVLESFESVGVSFFGKNFTHYLESITNEYYKVSDMLQGHKELLDDLRDTNDSLLTTKSNSIMKILTIVAFTTIPINLATQLLAMNTNVSFLQNITDGVFFIVLGLTGVVSLSMFLYFKMKRWF